MTPIDRCQRRVLQLQDQLVSLLVLCGSSLVASLALVQMRPFFGAVGAIGAVAAAGVFLGLQVARDERDHICDQLTVEGALGQALPHRSWLERERTQRRAAARLRQLCRTSVLPSRTLPVAYHRRTVRSLEPRLLLIAEQLDRHAGQLPAEVTARVRLLLAANGPLVARSTRIAVHRAMREADRQLDRLEAALAAH